MRPKTKRKVRDGDPGLNQKQKTQASRKLFSTPTIPKNNKTVYTQLGSPRQVPTCWACGASKNLTKYHAPGGALAICATCKNGGLV